MIYDKLIIIPTNHTFDNYDSDKKVCNFSIVYGLLLYNIFDLILDYYKYFKINNVFSLLACLSYTHILLGLNMYNYYLIVL